MRTKAAAAKQVSIYIYRHMYSAVMNVQESKVENAQLIIVTKNASSLCTNPTEWLALHSKHGPLIYPKGPRTIPFEDSALWRVLAPGGSDMFQAFRCRGIKARHAAFEWEKLWKSM